MTATGGARTRRDREEPTEPIPWRILQDKRISFRAAGILGELLSLPDHWQTSATKLAEGRKEGRDAVETALSELDKAGYLIRRRLQFRNGTWGWLWIYGTRPERLAQLMAEELDALRGELHPTWLRKHMPTGPPTLLRAVE